MSDWLAAGGTRERLEAIVAKAPLWQPTIEPWPTLEPFDKFDLPEFPIDALPPALRDWVKAEADATQTPSDLAGLLCLAVCGAMIARRVEVSPRAGFYEPTNVFVVILLPPANRKSAVFSDATRPLQELEREFAEAARPEVAREQSRRRQAEARLKKLERVSAEKGCRKSAEEAESIAATLAEQPEPVLRCLCINDATPEAIALEMAKQGGRMASLSAEGGVFDLMAGMYSKNGSPNFDVYLKGHAGDELRTNRISREAVRVSKPALTCAYAIQPIVLDRLKGDAVFRGRGLLARFLYAVPASLIGRRKIAPAPVPEAVSAAYRNVVFELGKFDGDFELRFTSSAAERFIAWEAEIEAMLAEGGELELMGDWGGKLAGATLRLAGIMHCVEHGIQGRIDKPILESAITIARYLIPHARKVLSAIEAKDAPHEADAEYVLRWIKRHGKQQFSKTEAHHHGKRRFPRADDIDPALGELERRGYIRSLTTETTGPGRKPSPTYEVNPEVWKSPASAKCSHNSRNGFPTDEPPDSGNSRNSSDASKTTRVQLTL